LEIFTVEARFPTLEPLSAPPDVGGRPGSAEYQAALADFNSRIHFYVTNSYVDEKGGDARLRENLLRTFSVARDSGQTTAYELADEDYFGLWRYNQLSCPTATACRKSDENYLNRAPTTPTVHIVCSAQNLSTNDERFACSAHELYRGFPLFYLIPHSQLNRWSEFESGVRRLLDRFAEDAEQR
jgi:hypothetical protein